MWLGEPLSSWVVYRATVPVPLPFHRVSRYERGSFHSDMRVSKTVFPKGKAGGVQYWVLSYGSRLFIEEKHPLQQPPWLVRP